MAMTASTVEAFLNSLTAMIESIRKRDSSRRMQQTESARQFGQLLAISPDFIRHFKSQCDWLDPDVAVRAAVDMLAAIAAAQSEPELRIR